MPLTTERQRVAHLLRRATFGPTPAEIDAALAMGLGATIDRLIHPERIDDDVDALVPRDAFDLTRGVDAVRYWLLRMITTKRQFQEKMTLFWHGHLTSGLSRTGGRAEYMVQQIDTYRALGLGNFRDLVLASAQDPAMILWLDSNQNRRGKPNENYARELMELFTLGIGNYSEADIREAAKAFTGWFQRDGKFVFTPGQHDNTSKTVLGFTGNWDGADVIDILVRQGACASFIARKLWSFFAYPNPEEAVTADIAKVFMESGYDLRRTIGAVFSHPAFYSDRAYHAVIKSPIEFAVGFIRQFGVVTDAVQLGGALTTMGQQPLNPPNVAGWPGGTNWISTTALLQRYNMINEILRRGVDQPTYLDMAALVKRHNLTTKDQILGFFADLMVDGDLSAAKLAALDTYLLSDDSGNPGRFELNQRTIDMKVRGLVHLIATSPEYQLN